MYRTWLSFCSSLVRMYSRPNRRMLICCKVWMLWWLPWLLTNSKCNKLKDWLLVLMFSQQRRWNLTCLQCLMVLQGTWHNGCSVSLSMLTWLELKLRVTRWNLLSQGWQRMLWLGGDSMWANITMLWQTWTGIPSNLRLVVPLRTLTRN